jgi:hypothetical protein
MNDRFRPIGVLALNGVFTLAELKSLDLLLVVAQW